MAKTNPIGVRFDKGLMEEIGGTAQSILIVLENFYKATKLLNKTPPLKFHEPTTKSFDAPLSHRAELDEVGQWKEHVGNSEIHEQIQAIRFERIPPERNTPIGKKIWESDQIKRINELKKLLK